MRGKTESCGTDQRNFKITPNRLPIRRNLSFVSPSGEMSSFRLVGKRNPNFVCPLN
jgi:hypothetical protein